MPTADPSSRPRRSDGERTHAAILEAATQLASIEGLEGLTIGRLAEELGVSKSGVYAHFGSREQLQLETIEAAQAIVEREVIAPAMQAPAGVRRLEALCAAYLSYVERLVFPGGCFFASLLAEMDARSGTFHEMAQAGARQWNAMFIEMSSEAQRRGEIGADVDLEQLAFELDACLELANYYFVLLRDPAILERAHRAVAGIIDRARASE
jgi:AcrR family transcriptional regulator